jgi:hypothetical protein
MMWFNTFIVWLTLKVAVNVWLEFMVSLQRPVPLHAPDQPTKKAPVPGVAFSDTTVPALNNALQVGLQLIPAGVLTTVPLEVPAN